MKKLLVLALALLPGTALGFSFGDTIGSGDPWTAANAAQVQTFLTAIDDCAAGEAVTGNGTNVTPSICIDFLTASEGNAAYEPLNALLVDGPASAINDTLVRFDGTTGKLVQGSLNVVSDTGDIAAASYSSFAGDVADAGIVRLGNAESICWEASPAGTDVCIAADAAENIGVTGGTLAATTAGALAANGANCSSGEVAGGVDASGVSEACLDPITESELATLADLDTQIGLTGTADGTTFLRGDGEWATPAGSGDVTGVGDCTSGDCLDGTSDGGTQITLYDAAATVVLNNAAGTLDISRPVTATSFTADDPGDGSRGVELVDNTATCADPTAGSTSICTIGGEPFTRDTGGTSREILYTAGGDYGDFTCSAGTCTVDASAVAISTDVSGLGTGVATFLGTPSSANLAAAVTGETGTGAPVFAASPVLTTPDLGTPSAATLTNATGLPASTGLTGVVAVANGGTGAAPGAGGNDVLIGTSATTSTWAPMPTSGTNGCDGTGEALQYNTATNSFDCLTGLGAGGTVDDISGDTGTTTGANVTIAGGTNGIDTSVSGDTLTMSLDLTEINSATFGSGTFTALTFNAGATDPTFTMGSDSVTVTNAATFDFEADSISTADLATEVRSMYWGAAGLSADGTNCADPAEVTINSGPILYTIICTDNDASTIYGSVTMPDSWDGGTVTFEHIYIQTAADTAALAGDIMAQCRGNGETPSSTWGTEVAIDDAGVVGSNSNDHTTSGAVTPAGTCAAGDTLYWRYQLDATGTATAEDGLLFDYDVGSSVRVSSRGTSFAFFPRRYPTYVDGMVRWCNWTFIADASGDVATGNSNCSFDNTVFPLEVQCMTTGGTAAINIEDRTRTGANSAGTDILLTDLSCSTALARREDDADPTVASLFTTAAQEGIGGARVFTPTITSETLAAGEALRIGIRYMRRE